MVMGTVVDRNRAICVQPHLKYEGYIRFLVSIGNNNDNNKWRGTYFVGKTSYIPSLIQLVSDIIIDRV